MKGPGPAELQRWSEEVARDPASLSFVPLAKAYRRMGRREAAMRLVLRGLERHPTHVEAHGLLALLYLDAGDRGRAADEWGMVLRLEPDNFDALRGMGFHYLESGDRANARRHLQHAAEQKPNDPAVREALSMIAQLDARVSQAPAHAEAPDDPWASPDPFAQSAAPAQRSSGDPLNAEPWADAPVGADPWDPMTALEDAIAPPTEIRPPAEAVAAARPAAPAQRAAAPASAPQTSRDPAFVFEPLRQDAPFLGALLLDEQGLVLAGTLASNDGSEDALGAILGGAIEEAARTAAHLSLGHWRGMLLEADNAVVHLAPVGEGLVVLMAAKRDAPTGWVLRTAARAAALAKDFLGVTA